MSRRGHSFWSVSERFRLMLALALAVVWLAAQPGQNSFATPIVSLLSFSAQCQQVQGRLCWETLNESNNRGFKVLRGGSSGGPYTDPVDIPLVLSAGNSGTYCCYDDRSVVPGHTYYYALVAIDNFGISAEITTTQLVMASSPLPTTTTSPTVSPTGTLVPSATATKTATVSPTGSRTRTATPTRTPSPSRTPKPAPTIIVTSTPTSTPSPSSVPSSANSGSSLPPFNPTRPPVGASLGAASPAPGGAGMQKTLPQQAFTGPASPYDLGALSRGSSEMPRQGMLVPDRRVRPTAVAKPAAAAAERMAVTSVPLAAQGEATVTSATGEESVGVGQAIAARLLYASTAFGVVAVLLLAVGLRRNSRL